MKNKATVFWKRTISLFLLVIVIMLGAFVLWAMVPHQPMDEVDAMLISDESVLVSNSSYLSFIPTNQLNTEQLSSTGYIIYPGARVSASSYAYIGRELAKQGIFVFVLKPPLRMAILDSNGAQEVIQDYPDIERWFVGGHSLGGATASIFVNEHLDSVEGIIYLAAYPIESNDFSATSLKVLTLYASEDGFATVDDIAKYDYLQPQNYTKVLIEGGNHEQFGYYGHQKGDNPSFITREEQQQIIVNEIANFLQK